MVFGSLTKGGPMALKKFKTGQPEGSWNALGSLPWNLISLYQKQKQSTVPGKTWSSVCARGDRDGGALHLKVYLYQGSSPHRTKMLPERHQGSSGGNSFQSKSLSIGGAGPTCLPIHNSSQVQAEVGCSEFKFSRQCGRSHCFHKCVITLIRL